VSVKVAVVGANGKMGALVCRTVRAAPDLELVSEIGRSDALVDKLRTCRAEVAVDFTAPECVEKHLEIYLSERVCPVVGTTGLAEAALPSVIARSREYRLGGVIAANFSVGAVLMMQLAARAAAVLPEVEIVEYHHPRKKDAPSGTALRTRQQILASTGAARETVPIHSVRMSGFLAHQEVILAGRGERLTVRHDAMDRECYMAGVLLAIRAAPRLSEITIGLDLLLDAAVQSSRAPGAP
jgi:4-hydroxy-tetrahydrodipicolinate reductase